jgi:hypothetical protein
VQRHEMSPVAETTNRGSGGLWVVPSPVDKSVPRPPRDVQPVRDVLCGPVVSGHRGHGRPGEVVVQHLSEPVVDGEADVDQCSIEAELRSLRRLPGLHARGWRLLSGDLAAASHGVARLYCASAVQKWCSSCGP